LGLAGEGTAVQCRQSLDVGRRGGSWEVAGRSLVAGGAGVKW